MNTLLNYTYFFFAAYCGITVCGYIVYKFEQEGAQTWEEGIKKLPLFFRHAVPFLYHGIVFFLSSHFHRNDIVNNGLILTNDEVIQLVKLLENHPYESPSLLSYVINPNGYCEIDVQAVGLTNKYENEPNKKIAKISVTRVRNYYIETRFSSPYISAQATSPVHLHIAIALSGSGQKHLQSLEGQKIPDSNLDVTLDLKEEIPEETADSESENRWDAL